MRDRIFSVNRRLIVLLPKQPVSDWLISVEPEAASLFALAKIREDQDGYLVPESIKDIEGARRWVQRRWEMLFAHFLNDWYTDRAVWPQKRSLKIFKEWFDVEFHSMLWDMADEPIDHEFWG